MLKTKVILEQQDLRTLKWSKYRNSSGTAGSFLKSYSKENGIKMYYKLSNYDNIKGVVGFECVNEIIVDRLLTIFGIEHLRYQLVHAEILVNGQEIDTFVCKSEDFKNPCEDKIPLDTYYELEHQDGESPLTFCINNGWENYIYTMLVVDFIILNRDRHGANIEVLRNKNNHSYRLSPLFDHGLSLLFNCHTNEEIASFDVSLDRPVNSYIGGRFAMENLKLIPKDKLPVLPKLSERYKDIIFQDLSAVIDNSIIEKSWEMISNRYKYYEDFCNSRE